MDICGINADNVFCRKNAVKSVVLIIKRRALNQMKWEWINTRNALHERAKIGNLNQNAPKNQGKFEKMFAIAKQGIFAISADDAFQRANVMIMCRAYALICVQKRIAIGNALMIARDQLAKTIMNFKIKHVRPSALMCVPAMQIWVYGSMEQLVCVAINVHRMK